MTKLHYSEMSASLKTALKSRRRKTSKLVSELDHFEPKVRALFELSVFSDLPALITAVDDDGPVACEEAEEFGEQEDFKSLDLFTPASDPPVPLKGRQTYRMWKAMVQLGSSPFTKSRLSENRKILHFVPLESYNIDSFAVDDCKSITDFFVLFLQAFFPGLEINLQNRFDVGNVNPTSRFHKRTLKKQFLVTDIYRRLHDATGLHKKDYILGLTWTDLYPSPDLNFALGEALYSHRCAVFSFGRYEPLAYVSRNTTALDSDGNYPIHQIGNLPDGESCSRNVLDDAGTGQVIHPPEKMDGETEVQPEAEDRADEAGTLRFAENSRNEKSKEGSGTRLENVKESKENDEALEITGDLLWKMMRVSSHEVCHLFGLSHCVFFKCSMNESKSVKEAVDQPLQLCPICLRKLQKFLNFDIPTRYRAMLDVCQRVQRSYPSERLGKTVKWYCKVLQFLGEDGVKA